MDDVEAHEVGFFDHCGEDAMLVSGIGGEGEVVFCGKGGEARAVGEVDLGIHEDDVGVALESGLAVIGCGFDGVGGLDQNIDGMIFKKRMEVSAVVGAWGKGGDIGCGGGIKIGDPTEGHAGSGIDLEGDAAAHAAGSDEADTDVVLRSHEGGC